MLTPNSIRIFSVVILIVAGMSIWLVWSYHQPNILPTPFDSKGWKTLGSSGVINNDPGCYRGGMALDILESNRLIGKTTEEVSSLLGNAEKILSSTQIYAVGQCSGGWEHSELVISYGANGRVTSAEFRLSVFGNP